MKKFMSLLLAAGMAASMAACGVAADTASSASSAEAASPAASAESTADIAAGGDLAYIQGKGKMVIGYTVYEPMNYTDADGKFTGFDTELAKAVCQQLGVEPEFVEINWDTKEVELSSKSIDCIWNGLTITDERKEAMDFTDPYLQNAQVIVVKKDSDIATKADLSGKTVGVQKSSSAKDALDADAIESELKEVVEYEENVSALQDLGIGRTDAVVVDKVVADWYIKDENADYKVLDETLAPELYGVAVKKGNTELLNKIQTAFDEIVADGTAAQISEKWFGSDIIYTGK